MVVVVVELTVVGAYCRGKKFAFGTAGCSYNEIARFVQIVPWAKA